MKLGDLINALADEIEVIRPELSQHLEVLTTLDVEDAKFSEAGEFYSEQVERMGEAAEMVGFPGLQHVCEHVNANITALTTKSVEEREDFIQFLHSWPDLVVHYLKHLDDPSAAAGLVDFLQDAPVQLDEEEALKIMHALGAFPGAMDSLEEEGQPKRPVLASPNDVALNVPADVDPNLLEGFYQEAPNQTEHLVSLLNNMLTDEGDMSDLVAAKRIVHTIKGTGAMIGLAGLANIGHHFEDILDYFENKGGEVNNKIATVLLDGGHCIAQMVAFLTGNDEFPNQSRETLQNIIDIANIIDRGGDLESIYLRGQSSDPTTQQPVQTISAKTTGSTGANAALRVSMERIEELFRVSAEVSVQTAAMEAQIKSLSDFNKRISSQQLRVKKRLFELETIVDTRSAAMMQSNQERVATGKSFDPLELEQYNELHSTTHALLEEFNDIFILSNELSQNLTSLGTLENRQQILARDLQHLVIGTRMSEVGSLEPRLQRNIRTTCQMTGKQAKLELIGGETLIDSDVLSQLAEPLLHILRNAVDHGIESPEERVSAGKDPMGTISLDFSAQGQQIILRCSDDGKGLDYQRILERAIENNLVNENDHLTNEEIGLLIFNSGFSTRDSVSQVSGRGVGMDVVRNWLNTMNGDIGLSSELHQGTTLTLSFASSLTTVQSLIVEAADQSFALPSVQIQQALSHDEGQFVESSGSLKYHHNDQVFAAMHLSDLLGFEHDSNLDTAFAILMTIQGEMWAIAVDNLIDSRELLLKLPGMYLRHIPGITGTSILGDGSIAIHLDMAQLIARAEGRSIQTVQSVSATKVNKNTGIANILIVDDSLSVRNTLQELIEDAGFNARTARDGIEAVNMLDDYAPDLVLTDLEMPNMNGVELTAHIRNRQDLHGLPVIMITSRSQEKHKEMAKEAGVDSYLTKPYNDTEVLTMINQSLAKVA